jgi:predicted dehydrogenase
MKVEQFRWGILGTGLIAEQFTKDVQRLPDHKVNAVGSRTQGKADAFGDKLGIPNRHSSYQSLVNDQNVDGIYVATHHPMHRRDTVLALNAGKPVLCEKPFAMSVADTEEMILVARSNNLLLMEAMWTRYLPHMIRIREIIASGMLGEIISVWADHGQWFEPDPESRFFKAGLGGGALFDLGIYTVSFASMVLGTPTKVTAISNEAFTGVDGQTSILLQYASKAHAILTTTNLAATPNRAVIAGTKARLEIDRIFYNPTSFTLISKSGEVLERIEQDYNGHGLREEAIEFVRCFREDLKESPMLPLDETLSIMKTMQEIKNQIGLTFPTFVM